MKVAEDFLDYFDKIEDICTIFCCRKGTNWCIKNYENATFPQTLVGNSWPLLIQHFLELALENRDSHISNIFLNSGRKLATLMDASSINGALLVLPAPKIHVKNSPAPQTLLLVGSSFQKITPDTRKHGADRLS